MDSILSNLKDLLTNIKNVTLPGMVAGIGFIILMWPPQPIDVIFDVQPNRSFLASVSSNLGPRENSGLITNSGEASANAVENPVFSIPWPQDQAGLKKLSSRIDPVCITAGTQRTLLSSSDLEDLRRIAVSNQYHLERIARNLRECMEKESSLSGYESSEIAVLTSDADVLKKERDALQQSYMAYEQSANPLRSSFYTKLQNKEHQIFEKQQEILQFEQLKRERDRRVAEFSRLQDEIKGRLADPGRLRPQEKVDDFLASLSKHIIAFLALAFAWSILFEPINRALFNFFYDKSIRNSLDVIYYKHRPRPVLKATHISSGFWLLWFIAFAASLALLGLVKTTGTGPHAADPCQLLNMSCKDVLPPQPKLFGTMVICICWTTLGVLFSTLGVWGASELLYAKSTREAHTETPGGVSSSEKQSKEADLSDKTMVRQTNAKKWLDKVKSKPPNTVRTGMIASGDAIQQCRSRLEALWEKIAQPEYAIGQGLLTRDDYNLLREQYYAQSQISIGLILPILFFAFAFLVTPQFGLGAGFRVWVPLGLIQAVLLSVGIDRRHKYETELELHIESVFMKTCQSKAESADTAKSKTPQPNLKDLIKSELITQLKNARVTNAAVQIVLPEEPPEKPQS